MSEFSLNSALIALPEQRDPQWLRRIKQISLVHPQYDPFRLVHAFHGFVGSIEPLADFCRKRI